jgi:ribose transport system substrate-binding protein
VRLLLVLALAVTLSACGAAPSRAPVAFLAVDARQNFVREMSEGFTAGVDEVGGVSHAESGPDIGDVAAQLDMFRGYQRTHPGGLSVFTQNPELFAGPLSEATGAGIPVIAVTCPPAPGSGVTLYIGNDNYWMGRTLAAQLALRLPKDEPGLVVLGENMPGMPTLDQRVIGLRDEFQQRFPKLTVLGPFDTKLDPAANKEAWEVLVRANPKALAFIGTGEADGRNLAAIRIASRGGWAAGSFGLDQPSLDAVKTGNLTLVSPEHFLQGAVAGRFQAMHAKTGAALPRGWIVISGIVVNATNIDAIIARQAWSGSKQDWFRPQIDDIAAHPARYLRSLSAVR